MTNPPETPPSTPPINIEIPNNLPSQYANFALIMHTPSEIILNFASVMPGMTSAPLHTRIVMTPLALPSVAPPVGAERLNVKVLLAVAAASLEIGIDTVFDVCPGVNVSVPLTAE